MKPTRSTNSTETTFRSSPPERVGSERLAAREAEARSLRVLLAAGRADDHRADLRSAPGRRLCGRRKRLVLVLGEPPLQDAPREDADEPMVLVHDRHALGVLRLEEAERLLERDVRADREVRRLGDRAELRLRRVEPARDRPRARASCA